MNETHIKEIMKRIELCSAVIVDREFHQVDYTIESDNVFGYSHPDTGNEYQVKVTDECEIKSNMLVIDGTEYKFKQLVDVNMNPERTQVQYQNSFETADIIFAAKELKPECTLVDETGLLAAFKCTVAEYGCTIDTSVRDVIEILRNGGEFNSFFEAK